MSLKLDFNTVSSKCMEKYIQKISEVKGIEVDELLSIWKTVVSSVEPSKKDTVKKPVTTVDKEDSICTDESNIDLTTTSASKLLKLKKEELQNLCRIHKKRTTGTKQQLVEFLLNRDISNEDLATTKPKVESKTKQVEETTSSISKKKVTPDVKKCKEILSKQINVIEKPITMIRKNADGLFLEHKTLFVFNTNKEVYGKVKSPEDSVVLPLTEDDIQTCKQRSWLYVIPENLDTDNLENERIDDLEDEQFESDEDVNSHISDNSKSANDVAEEESSDEDSILDDVDDDDPEEEGSDNYME